MLLRKAHGGAEVAGYTWAHDGDVVEVDDATAMELLHIPGGDYSVAQPGDDPAQPAGHGHDGGGDAGSGGGPSDPAPETADGDTASGDSDEPGAADPAEADAAEPSDGDEQA